MTITELNIAVRPGQVWQDKDNRPAGRQLRVAMVRGDSAWLRNVRTGRGSTVKLARLVKHYELVEDAP